MDRLQRKIQLTKNEQNKTKKKRIRYKVGCSPDQIAIDLLCICVENRCSKSESNKNKKFTVKIRDIERMIE